MTVPAEVTVVYVPTDTARAAFVSAGGDRLSARPAVLPVAGDEILIGDVVFLVLRRRIDPGPPPVVRLTLDHPSRPQGLRR
jgi:hypothetical protein